MQSFKILSISFILSIGMTGSATAQDISYDKEMGKKYAAQVDSSMGVYDDKEKTAYIDAIGQRLVAQLDEPLFEYKFKKNTMWRCNE